MYLWCTPELLNSFHTNAVCKGSVKELKRDAYLENTPQHSSWTNYNYYCYRHVTVRICKRKDLHSTPCISPCQVLIWLGKQDYNYWREEGGYKQRALFHGPSCIHPGSEMQWLHQLWEGHVVILQNLFPCDMEFQLCTSGQQSVKAPLMLRWPVAYRSLQMGARELQCCVDVKAAGRESWHVRIDKALCKKVTTAGLHSEGQPKGCNSKGHRQGMRLKKEWQLVFQTRKGCWLGDTCDQCSLLSKE